MSYIESQYYNLIKHFKCLLFGFNNVSYLVKTNFLALKKEILQM